MGHDPVAETVDLLRGFGLRLIQPRQGYRFSLDPLILCGFCGIGREKRVVDLGTGCGVIPLVLARGSQDASFVGVEFQEGMAELARRNVALNGLSERIETVADDVLTIRERFPVSSFDLVTANPPYRKRGTGKVSPKAGRDDARHESTATIGDFLSIAKYLVKPSGRICFIYHPSRLGELFAEAAVLKLTPLRLRMVHGNRQAGAGMFLVELAKGRKGELKVLPPLFVYDEQGDQSDEMRMIQGETRC